MNALAASLAFFVALLPLAAFADAFETEILERHNALRARHGAPPLAWNEQLASYALQCAQENAHTDNMHHRPNNKYGENIYWTSAGALTGAKVTDTWYAEASQ